MDDDRAPVERDVTRLTSIRGDRADEPSAGITPALEALGAGRAVLMVDNASDRGWFVCAAERASTEFIVQVTTYGCGVVCAAMEADGLTRLAIPALDSGSGMHLPVDLVGAQRARTADLVATLHALADPQTAAGDLVSPGHVFPVAAGDCGAPDDGGIARSMVEASRLAGCAPVTAYAQAVDEQGFPADRRATARLARRLGVTLAPLRDVLLHRESIAPAVEREVETTIPTPAGRLRAVGYRGRSGAEYVTFLSNAVGDGMRVHIHRRCQVSDVFGGVACGCGAALSRALEEIHHSGNGMVVYYGDPDRLPGVHQERPAMSWDTTIELTGIVRDLGARRIFLSSNEPVPIADFEALGVAVAGTDVDWLGLPPAPRATGL